MIERNCAFNIGEKKFIANFPNVGQIIDMESLKQALTNNRYGTMAASGIASMYYALDMVDAIAFFQVCVPSVAKYYDIRNYTALAPEKIQELVDAYKEQIKPWYDKIMSELRGVTKDSGNNSESGADAEEEGQ